MSDDRKPVTGPIPIYVRTIPTGVVLDLEALTRLVVGDVLDALLAPADTGVWDRLHALADTDRAAVEGRLPYEELVADLTERASSRVPLYGQAALELMLKLSKAAAPRLDSWQRGAA
ncbi:hypothetical protein RB625_19565 [Streptomyces californicus]|uniref:hypothetical protein n=1 Tax=Streptomyces californicus TaxID=67351 RepID=UPI00296F4DE6|nr:hypothetical protein [Streptomyces californicus]MDW4900610.1 hypothetical protein [Streptomyces californicus]